MLQVRKAVISELDRLMEIYRHAQDFMIRAGNPTQWAHSYPTTDMIADDIACGRCHVLYDAQGIHGVFALFEGEDPTYREIEGAWLNDRPYVTIHRMASDGKVHGVFARAADYCKRLSQDVRVDTHIDNVPMRGAIRKERFVHCGVVHVRDGTARQAYHWAAPEVVLRDMRAQDVEDNVRWFTEDVKWMDFDAPWETAPSTPEAERADWTAYYEQVKDLPSDQVKGKFEIEYEGRHVGWVCRYTDLDYMDNPSSIPAVGIDIPEYGAHDRGVGTEALRQFIRYLFDHGFDRVFTQTWSGNAPMLRVAAKLGFVPICVRKDYRQVDGKPYDAITFALDRREEE